MTRILRLLAYLLLGSPVALLAADFNVTTPGGSFYYIINGGAMQNPTLTLTRGVTYTFAVNADSFHPFEIVDSTQNPYNDGVQNNNVSHGTITFTVPMTAPDQLAYICSFHLFGGTINIVGGAPSDFHITTPGDNYAYTFNNFSGDNPTLTLTRGMTYVFDVQAWPDHPFAIVNSLDTGELYEDGVVNNNTAQGRITFTVPASAPSTLYYICFFHFFGGVINIVDPPLPPAPMVKVISISVGQNIVTLKSLGTNGWTAIPEFSSNLLSASWSTVPSYTNTYANGTNTTTFGRLEPICGPNVFLRVKNTGN